MNDDFDAMLYFDKDVIKDKLQYFLDNHPIIQKIKEYIGQADPSQIDVLTNQFYNMMVQQLDENADYISNLIQQKIKFACFSEDIFP